MTRRGIRPSFSEASPTSSTAPTASISPWPRSVEAQVGSSASSRLRAIASRLEGSSVSDSAKVSSGRVFESKAWTASWSAGRASATAARARAFALAQRSPRRRLALVSIRTRSRRRSTSPKFRLAASRKNGLENARASNASAEALSRSRKMLSSRLRRVSRGGVGARNIRELKGTSPFGVRRIRWSTMGAAMASAPRT